MLKIGLTGGIASGKSTVTALFSNFDITIIDADHISRALVQPDQPCYKSIVDYFGSDILLTSGDINRKQLAETIFSDPQSKLYLEELLHPEIRTQLMRQSAIAKSNYCIVAIPLLIEAKMTDLVDRILVIDTSTEHQIERLCLRDNIPHDKAQLIVNQQCTREQRLTYADDIINNDASEQQLIEQVKKLHLKYSNLINSLVDGCQ